VKTTGKKILISIVGDPSSYKEATYHYDRGTKSDNFSSSILIDVEKPDKKILIGQYTLAEKGESFEELQRDSLRKISSNISTASSYDEKIISPGVFYSRKKNGDLLNFKGEIYDFYAYTLYKLARIFESINDDVAVILDLTHGINYMGYLTLSAVNLILSVYSLSKKVKMTVVNSDPYPSGFNNPSNPNLKPDLNINTVLKREIKPSFLYPASSEKPLRPYVGEENLNVNKKNLGMELNKDLKDKMECVSNGKYFVNSINTGALLSSFRFADNFQDCVNFVVDYFIRNVRTSRENISFNVIPAFSFTQGFETLVVAEMIERIVSINNEVEVGIDELEKRAKIYEDTVMNEIVQNEIKGVKDLLECQGDWISLTELMCRKGRNFSKDPDRRTFIAHAGLPVAFVEINCKEKKLRYKSDVVDKIKNLLS